MTLRHPVAAAAAATNKYRQFSIDGRGRPSTPRARFRAAELRTTKSGVDTTRESGLHVPYTAILHPLVHSYGSCFS